MFIRWLNQRNTPRRMLHSINIIGEAYKLCMLHTAALAWLIPGIGGHGARSELMNGPIRIRPTWSMILIGPASLPPDVETLPHTAVTWASSDILVLRRSALPSTRLFPTTGDSVLGNRRHSGVTRHSASLGYHHKLQNQVEKLLKKRFSLNFKQLL